MTSRFESSLPAPRGRVAVVPSILSADAARLGGQIRLVEKAGADWIQVDVMDGHFVPNLSFGPAVVRSVRKVTRLPIDVHLMVENPGGFFEAFAEAGADLLTVHAEAVKNAGSCLRNIRRMGLKAGLAVKPGTPLRGVEDCLAWTDLLLIMTVDPGFGGQEFIPGVLGKIRSARAMLKLAKSSAWLQVDGGINVSTAVKAAAAGADSLVVGSAVFSTGDPAGALKNILKAVNPALSGRHPGTGVKSRL